jgi:hypothetical protein
MNGYNCLAYIPMYVHTHKIPRKIPSLEKYIGFDLYVSFTYDEAICVYKQSA